MRAALLTVAISLTAAAAQAPPTLTAAQAKDHLGEQATVCGKVVTANYAASARGQPTFLNLDQPYPKPIFTVLIWREQRAKIGVPEQMFRDKTICVSGRITSYRGDPQIEVSDPKQIVVKR
jgi:DNA/RNA endonuclease YhcR with UshA esterase domain